MKLYLKNTIPHFHVRYSIYFKSTARVIGVTNSYYYNPSLTWEKEDVVNWGYGIETTCISNRTILDWAPVPNLYSFGLTSNAASIVSGILALVEEYQDNYKSDKDLNIFRVHETLNETSAFSAYNVDKLFYLTSCLSIQYAEETLKFRDDFVL